MRSDIPPLSRQGLARRRLALTFALGWAAGAVRAQDAAGGKDGEILLGQSCQLDGPLAAITTEVRQGASLYFDHVNAAGGVHGRKIRVVALDDAYDPKKAADNTKKFIDEEKVLALFQYAGTPPSLAALPIAEERGVPFIAPFTGSEGLRQASSRYVFNIKAGYASELDATIKQLASVGISRIAAVYLNNAFGTGGLASVEKSAKTYNVTLVAQAPLEVDGSKMAVAVEVVAKQTPQAVIVISAGKPSVDFVDAYMTAGHKTTFYMMSVISNAQLVQALGARARAGCGARRSALRRNRRRPAGGAGCSAWAVVLVGRGAGQRCAHGGFFRRAPARAHVLVGPYQVGGAGARIEPLRRQTLDILHIHANLQYLHLGQCGGPAGRRAKDQQREVRPQRTQQPGGMAVLGEGRVQQHGSWHLRAGKGIGVERVQV